MRERAQARIDLEAAKLRFASCGFSADMSIEAIEEKLPEMEANAGACGKEILRLSPLATYGPSMAQKVIDTCARFDMALEEIREVCAQLTPIPMEDSEPEELGPNPHEEFARLIA